jgi:hypothetical protein
MRDHPFRGALRRAAALALCGAICLGALTGCSALTPAKAQSAGAQSAGAQSAGAQSAGAQSAGKAAQSAVSGRNPGAAPGRTLIPYAQMQYTPCTQQEMDAALDPLYALARSGGSRSDFAAADAAARAELEKAATAYTLIELRYADDPSDAAVASEALDAAALVAQANDSWWQAMHAVAASSAARPLLEAAYTHDQIQQFLQYSAGSYDASQDLYAQENALVQQYDQASAAADPDPAALRALYVQLVAVRRQIAQQYGYDSYADYAYEQLYARTYTPQDAQAIWQAAKDAYVPMSDAHAKAVYNRTAPLRTDGSIDCSPDAILAALGAGAQALSPSLYEAYTGLRRAGLYDIAASDTKLNAGYTTYLYSYGEPFIYNAPTGTYYDYTAVFHEFGHFASFYRSGSDLLLGTADNDLCELQSQGMEVQFLPRYEEIFGAQDGPAIRDDVVLNLFYSVEEGAMYDEFQQRVYAADDLTADSVQALFEQVCAEYGYDHYADYENDWLFIAHNFEDPFYYISYAVSAIPALELYGRAAQDPAGAADVYLALEAMDPEQVSFADALAQTGLADVFNAADAAQIAQEAGARFTY